MASESARRSNEALLRDFHRQFNGPNSLGAVEKPPLKEHTQLIHEFLARKPKPDGTAWVVTEPNGQRFGYHESGIGKPRERRKALRALRANGQEVPTWNLRYSTGPDSTRVSVILLEDGTGILTRFAGMWGSKEDFMKAC